MSRTIEMPQELLNKAREQYKRDKQLHTTERGKLALEAANALMELVNLGGLANDDDMILSMAGYICSRLSDKILVEQGAR